MLARYRTTHLVSRRDNGHKVPTEIFVVFFLVSLILNIWWFNFFLSAFCSSLFNFILKSEIKFLNGAEEGEQKPSTFIITFQHQISFQLDHTSFSFLSSSRSFVLLSLLRWLPCLSRTIKYDTFWQRQPSITSFKKSLNTHNNHIHTHTHAHTITITNNRIIQLNSIWAITNLLMHIHNTHTHSLDRKKRCSNARANMCCMYVCIVACCV